MEDDQLNQSRSSQKRTDLLNGRRKEKLRQELVNRFGINNIDFIDKSIQEKAEGLFYNGKAYGDVYQNIENGISEQVESYTRVQNPNNREHQGNPNTQDKSPAASDPSQRRQSYNNNAGYRGVPNLDQSLLDKVGRDHTQGSDRRILPIKPKERVFDEWAAVIRHADEVQEAAKQQEKMMYRISQQKYKEELDSQKAAHVGQQHNFAQKFNSDDRQFFEENQRKIQNDIHREQQERMKIKELETRFAHESLDAKQKWLQHQRELTEKEKDAYKGYLNSMESDERKKMITERINKQQKAKDLHDSLFSQENARKMKEQEDKQVDRRYAQLEANRMSNWEADRQKYFENLKKFQKDTEVKEKIFAAVVPKQDLNLLAKKDEVAYIERLQRQKEEGEDSMRRDIERKYLEQSTTANLLSQQIMRKQIDQKMNVQQDKDYAKHVQSIVTLQNNQEMQIKSNAKSRQKEYYEHLGKQLKESEQRKKFTGVMSEHERRVNMSEIKAYENRDTFDMASALSNKKIPIGANRKSVTPGQWTRNKELQDSLSQAVDQHNKSVSHPRNSSVDNFSMHSAQLNGGRQQVNYQDPPKSVNNVMSSGLMDNIYRQKEVNNDEIESLQKLMDSPEAKQMRANTMNRAYGYDNIVQTGGAVDPILKRGQASSQQSNNPVGLLNTPSMTSGKGQQIQRISVEQNPEMSPWFGKKSRSLAHQERADKGFNIITGQGGI